MMVQFDTSKKNLGSSKKMFDYLDKENIGKKADDKDLLFNQYRDDITPEEATKEIDLNVAKLGKKEEKYFSFHISPSADEIKIIDGDTNKMKEYVREVMDAYAKNFNGKNLIGKDLVYYAKIERTRSFKNKDLEVKNGTAKIGEKKFGDQLHVHVIVSRKDVTNTKRLSPKDNSKGGNNFSIPTVKSQISRGFNRNKFIDKTEELFDKKFNYVRVPENSFEYKRLKEHHSELFQEKFGTKPIKHVTISDLSNEFSKREYTEKHVNKILFNGQNKVKSDAYLKQRGITFGKNNVNYNGKDMSYDSLDLTKAAGDMIKVFYLTKKLGKNIEGKEEEKEKER